MPKSKELERSDAAARSAAARAVRDPVSRRQFVALAGGSTAAAAGPAIKSKDIA